MDLEIGFPLLLFIVLTFVFLVLAVWNGRRAHDAERRLEELQKEHKQLVVEKERASTLADRVPELEQQVEELRKQREVAERQSTEVQTRLETERTSHAERVVELQKMGNEIEAKFASLASEVLGKNSEAFLSRVSERFDKHKVTADKDLQERQKTIETLINPIRDNLAKFEKQVGEIEKAREGAYGAINQQVKDITEGLTGLRSETGRLRHALQQPITRGRWGEYQLRNVLEMAGMTENVDFVQQKTIQSAEGRMRPDVIIRLPGGKSVVVDAKTPLEAYLAAAETSDENEREQKMAQHVQHVRTHIHKLGSQEYWKAVPDTLDFVVMFIPVEAASASAFQRDPELLNKAMRDRVFISSPTTFIALVKAIAHGWQQKKLTENAKDVANNARTLYERIKIFAKHTGELGKHLLQVVNKYNEMVGSLESRVLPAARNFKKLGVAPAGEKIPEIEPATVVPRDLQAAELLSPPVEKEPQD
ncbi:MAG: DNA recombination protein RmuC [Nitrospira sp.]|nr:DNA recombination protein RmuC [Nitrospira sp.]